VTIPRRLGWVWRTPPEALPSGLEAMLVRAADATSTEGPGGIDYAANYRAWKRALGPRVLPWTRLGPTASTDGIASAEVVAAAAPGELLYVVEIQGSLPDTEVVAFANRLRALVPGALLGFSSYPTRAQASSHGVPWDACVAAFDLGLPQVHFPNQRAELARVVADHRGRGVHIAVSPGDDSGWAAAATTGITQYLGASLWRHGLDQFTAWAQQLGDVQGGDEFDMATIADLENAVRKVLNEGTGQGQASWAATSAAGFAATQALPDRLDRVDHVTQATKEAVDALHLTLTDGEVQAIAGAVAAKLSDLPPATLTDGEVQAIADAVAAKLIDIPLGTVALDEASITGVGEEVSNRVADRLGPSVIAALRAQLQKP